MKRFLVLTLPVLLLPALLSPMTVSRSQDQIPTSAPLLTDSAGATRNVASESVFRVICPSANSMGTGFLHSSGNILTAAHLLGDLTAKEVFVITSKGTKIDINEIVKDVDTDIAMLCPKSKINASSLRVSEKITWPVGAQVATWGYPAGYSGRDPMLSVGYLSGVDVVRIPTGKLVERTVVNAAFNAGNSGGPLVDVESSHVIGIVASKLAPLPAYIESALKALKETKSGVTFKRTKSDGTTEDIVEAQVLEEILRYLRSQTQLVVGHAVTNGQICEFLKRHKISSTSVDSATKREDKQ